MIKFLLREISDTYIRKNFELLRDFFANEAALLRGQFKFIEITVPSAQANYKVAHSLGFQPKDVLVTSLTGAGAVTWNYSLFDRDNLDLTTTGACVIRAFIGAYEEGTVS
jgi:hypothetical protein